RRGEFLYQDFLYDDHGAHEVADPSDPRAASEGDLFSKPNGTYTYPTGPGYAGDAADLVEFRVKPQRKSTLFRITLNTLENPSLVAFSVAIGGRPGHAFQFPDGANVKAPASLFLTVHPSGGRMVADLVQAGSGTRVRGAVPRVRVDRRRRQITVAIAHRSWNPRRRTIRLAAGVGLWNSASRSYLLPRAQADATHPGGAGTAARPAAFFNVAFRRAEPFPSPSEGPRAVLDAAWWRDRAQGGALAQGDISQFYANVSFRKLARKKRDDSGIPRSGPMDRILASRFSLGQGTNFSHECGFGGASNPRSCTPEYLGQLEPYAIYIPRSHRPHGGYGMTLLLHSLSANYNQFLGTNNQHQFGERPSSSIVLTTEARGPDQFYQGYGGAEVFEAWADVARRYRLNPAYTQIAGYSMGGLGTFTLAEQFPDLFARAQPTVGDETNHDVLASLRNVPVLMWNNSADELVNPGFFLPTANALDSLGYRYELDTFVPCALTSHPEKCSPLFPDHLELAINDQYAPAAAFLDDARVNLSPAHVTYVVDAARNRPDIGLGADHAYWLYHLKLRNPSQHGASGDPEGKVDAFSHGIGRGDPHPGGTQTGAGTLTGGNLGPLHFTRTSKQWGSEPSSPRSNVLDLTATNISAASIDVKRAHVNCQVGLNVHTDGPLTITLEGCKRVAHFG
ncbi:MAG: hypothetical protein JOZ73_10845, partial [Solirubrobacterales bacterium]|nr:hypothetical protein [Solirubrobacterales bacterium]